MLFITGASGVVGEVLISKLLNLGYKLRCLKRSTSKIAQEHLENPNVEWVEESLNNFDQLTEFLEGIDTVIHCAALVSFDSKDRDALYQTNVDLTTNLVNACLERNIEKFVYLSSIASVGIDKNKTLQDEKNQWEADKNNSDYAITKQLAEQEVWRGNAEGLNTVILNPSVILSRPNTRSSGKLVSQLMKTNHFIPNAEINTVDVRDVVNIIINVMNREDVNGERFILSNDKPIKLIELYNGLNTKQKNKPREINLATLKLVYFMDKYLSKVTKRSRKLNKEILKLKTNTYLYNNRKSKEWLNYQYFKVEKTCEWILENTNESYISDYQMT